MPYRNNSNFDHAMLHNICVAQRDRLACIDFHLLFCGKVSRQDIVDIFGVSPAMVTRDLSLYRQLAPKNAAYDTNKRLHLRSDKFKALFRYNTGDILDELQKIEARNHRSSVIVYDSPEIPETTKSRISPMIYRVPLRLVQPPVEIIANVYRAISNHKPLRITYASTRNGVSTRIIVPHTLIYNDAKLYVRAYDRKTEAFRDFVASRIQEIWFPELHYDHYVESIQADKQWQQTVKLHIIPHPNLKHPESVMMDYDMTEEGITVPIRAAIAGYLLRLWRVDASKDHRLNPFEYRLWLANQHELKDIDSLYLAPGYADN